MASFTRPPAANRRMAWPAPHCNRFGINPHRFSPENVVALHRSTRAHDWPQMPFLPNVARKVVPLGW